MIYRDRRAILIWLSACLFLVAAMVFVGGYTRLSGSGLSITEWKPIHGVMPPMSEVQWQEEFAAYKATPQYAKINKGMSLTEFKTIFWPEFFHRLLARTVGMVFFIPLLIFAARRSISKVQLWKLAGIFALGGVQGLIGWVMVASGLVDNPYVSHLKLALHLGIAFVIFALIQWQLTGAWCLVRSEKKKPGTKNQALSTYYFWFSALALQIILGAFLAGLHGGLVYNSWPDMNGEFMPFSLQVLDIGQALHRPDVIQFLHRTVAILVVFSFLFWWYSHQEYVKNSRLGRVCAVATLVMFGQFTLGVLTLLHMVPLPLALAHQMCALLLWSVAVLLLYKLKHND